MAKKISLLLITALLFLCPAAGAREYAEVFVDGKKIEFDTAVPYVNDNNVTMIPLRYAAQALGCAVYWERAGKNTVTVEGEKSIILEIGKSDAVIDGKTVKLASVPYEENGRTYVPLRFISENMGYKTEWKAPNVYITADSAEIPMERRLNTERWADNEEVNVLDFGADPGGVKECTSAIRRAHNTGKRVYYPNGVYRFNGANLNLSGGVRFESNDGVIIHNDLSDEPIMNFDDFGNFVGLQQGHLERYTATDTVPITDGNIVSPPLSESEYDTKADFIVHWYNDFGLEFTRQRASAWNGWYYWTWNYHNAGAGSKDPYALYDPERHPMLGYYRGDDPKILDWQCYWLKEYGVTGAVLYTTDYTDWEKPGALAHWIYELFNETPNFEKIKYIMTMHINYVRKGEDHTADEAKIRANWREVIEKTYFSHKENPYIMDINGGKYPVIYIHEEMAVPGVFDNYDGAKNAAAFYKELAGWFKEQGYDGIAIFARHFDERFDPEDADLKENGVYRFNAKYEGGYGAGYTYEEMLNNQQWPADENYILNVFTAADTHDPHPSKWRHPGHSPENFSKLLNEAMEQLYKEGSVLPKVITCYNMSEWAEGGPGLQPNMKNGFAYLEAIRDAVIKDK